MNDTLRIGASLRYRSNVIGPLQASACLRTYRDATEGLGSRFRFPSHDLIRAGAQPSPHERLLTFLVMGRMTGQPRSWGERQANWVTGQVSQVWRDVYERDEWLETVELQAENSCNEAELRYRLHPTPESKDHLIACLRAEAARELARANALERGNAA